MDLAVAFRFSEPGLRVLDRESIAQSRDGTFEFDQAVPVTGFRSVHHVAGDAA